MRELNCLQHARRFHLNRNFRKTPQSKQASKQASSWNKFSDILLEILKLIKSRENIELVLTDRFSPLQIVKIADFAIELLDLKHPCDREILAKVGIDYHQHMKNLGYSDEEIANIKKQENDVK